MILSGRQTICVRTPAKINLVLKVLERLPNGYHALWSLMQTVTLEDELSVEVAPAAAGVTLHCSDARLPADGGNLVYRAAELFLERAGERAGLNITLMKRIPMGAGLGGGSSDAAATLAALNVLLDVKWPNQTLAEIGASLGSDVPFFFSSPTALIRGWGQSVQAKTLHGSRWIVLINPGFPISTKMAYDRLSASRTSVPALAEPLHALERSDVLAWDSVLPIMENDFESALFPVHPELHRVKTSLLEAGADAALLSGSGATVFGIFAQENLARRAGQRVARAGSMQGFVVQTACQPSYVELNPGNVARLTSGER